MALLRWFMSSSLFFICVFGDLTQEPGFTECVHNLCARNQNFFEVEPDCTDPLQRICTCTSGETERMKAYEKEMDTPFIKNFPQRICPPLAKSTTMASTKPTTAPKVTLEPPLEDLGSNDLPPSPQKNAGLNQDHEEHPTRYLNFNDTILEVLRNITSHCASCPALGVSMQEGGWIFIVFIAVVYLVCLYGSVYFSIYYMRKSKPAMFVFYATFSSIITLGASLIVISVVYLCDRRRSRVIESPSELEDIEVVAHSVDQDTVNDLPLEALDLPDDLILNGASLNGASITSRSGGDSKSPSKSVAFEEAVTVSTKDDSNLDIPEDQGESTETVRSNLAYSVSHVQTLRHSGSATQLHLDELNELGGPRGPVPKSDSAPCGYSRTYIKSEEPRINPTSSSPTVSRSASVNPPPSIHRPDPPSRQRAMSVDSSAAPKKNRRSFFRR